MVVLFDSRLIASSGKKNQRHLAHLMSCTMAVQFAPTSLTVSRYSIIDCVFAQHKGVQKCVPGLVFGFTVFSFPLEVTFLSHLHFYFLLNCIRALFLLQFQKGLVTGQKPTIGTVESKSTPRLLASVHCRDSCCCKIKQWYTSCHANSAFSERMSKLSSGTG